MQFCVRDGSVKQSQVKYPISLHIYKVLPDYSLGIIYFYLIVYLGPNHQFSLLSLVFILFFVAKVDHSFIQKFRQIAVKFTHLRAHELFLLLSAVFPLKSWEIVSSRKVPEIRNNSGPRYFE